MCLIMIAQDPRFLDFVPLVRTSERGLSRLRAVRSGRNYVRYLRKVNTTSWKQWCRCTNDGAQGGL